MEKYHETSQVSKGKLVWMGLSILILLIWIGIEVKGYLDGKPSFLGIAYIGLFAGLIFWRYAVRYVYSLTDHELTITSQILFYNRKFTVPFDSVESYSDKYVRSIFKRTGMSSFVHRYSSGDGRVTRILIFTQNGKSNAVLFKVSDRFMKELKVLAPKGKEK